MSATPDKLRKIADSTCFLNHNFFHRNLDMDWFKLYLLFYDHFLFESDYTTNLSNGLVFRYPTVWREIEKNSIFLQEVGGFNDRKEINKWALEQLRPVLLTKSGMFNKRFFRSFSSRMKLRGGGISDKSFAYELLQEYGARIELGGWDREVLDEFVDAYLSVQVRQSTGIPSVLDPVGDWIIRKVFPNSGASDAALNTFEKVVIDEVPNFYKLSWDAILQLRASKYRKHCVRYIQEIPFDRTIKEHLRDSLWRLVTEVATESSVRKSVIKGIAGNLPGLPLNPISLALSGKDTWNVKERINACGWIYFISEIRTVNKDRAGVFTLLPRNIRSNSD